MRAAHARRDSAASAVSSLLEEVEQLDRLEAGGRVVLEGRAGRQVGEGAAPGGHEQEVAVGPGVDAEPAVVVASATCARTVTDNFTL